MEEERKKLLFVRVVTVGTVRIGKCVLRAVKAAYHTHTHTHTHTPNGVS